MKATWINDDGRFAFGVDGPTAVELTKQEHRALLDGISAGMAIARGEDGRPILIDPNPPVTATSLCISVDNAADAARAAVAGDPLRAVEYDRARAEAEQFAAAGYQGEVPPMVAAWAINGRSAQDAADGILYEAARYTNALVQIRVMRLQAKDAIRAAMATGQVEQAESAASEAIAAIRAAVNGVGNNAGSA